MKRLLSILSAIGLTAVTASSVVACGDQIQTWAMPKGDDTTKPIVEDTQWDSKACTVTLQLSAELKTTVGPSDIKLVDYVTKEEVAGFKVASDKHAFYRVANTFVLNLSLNNRKLLKEKTKYQLLVKGITTGSDADSSNYFTYSIPDIDKPDGGKTA